MFRSDGAGGAAHGTAAVCHMRFDIDYRIGEDRFVESGTEVYVVDCSGTRPQVVWRTQASQPRDPS